MWSLGKSKSQMSNPPGVVRVQNHLKHTLRSILLIGVIIYTLLGGYCPFDEPNPMEVIRKIRNGDYEFHAQYWDHVSKDAKKLIKRLLRVDPDERYTAKKALKSKWITTDAAALATRDLGNNLSQFRLFCAKRKFKIAINAIIAANKLKELSTSNHSSSSF
jgi:calcium/calmodulin-dependent protein kinase I